MTKTQHIVCGLLDTFGGHANKQANQYRLLLNHDSRGKVDTILMHWAEGYLTIKAFSVGSLVSTTLVYTVIDAIQFINRYHKDA